jgi:hypothetical protein
MIANPQLSLKQILSILIVTAIAVTPLVMWSSGSQTEFIRRLSARYGLGYFLYEFAVILISQILWDIVTYNFGRMQVNLSIDARKKWRRRIFVYCAIELALLIGFLAAIEMGS